MVVTDTDTICAIATPPGRSGIGIVRISGPGCRNLSNKILGFSPQPRKAYYCSFNGANSEPIDQGIAIYFQAPNSFTGEDVLELQGHGGIFVLNNLLKSVLDLGCRMARPGEFSERAFLNNKLDLIQVEAIADLINANTEKAAKSAVRSLEGEFSRRINKLVSSITELRVYLEAAIDFTDEDIDFISEGNTLEKLEVIIQQADAVFRQARVGAILQEGIHVAIAGRPNAGKSSLLNSLSGKDTAIVTNIPGTTRDTLKELIDIDGIPVHIIDTAGLRASTDVVEQEGVKRARQAIEDADVVVLVLDSQLIPNSEEQLDKHFDETGLPENVLDTGRLLLVFNKTDLLERQQLLDLSDSAFVKIRNKEVPTAAVSAKSGEGTDKLRNQLKNLAGVNTNEEGSFSARERQLRAMESGMAMLKSAHYQLRNGGNLELVAEDLRQAQRSLGEITGEVTTDDLLGQIFSSFCIGK